MSTDLGHTSQVELLRQACIQGDAILMQCILEASDPPSINDADVDGFSLLHHAARAGFCDVIDVLLHAKPPADVFVRQTQTRERSLQSAAQFGHAEAVRKLLHAAPDEIDYPFSGDGLMTAFDYAAQNGHLETALVLLQAKPPASVQHPTATRSALHLAAREGQSEVVRALLSNEPPANVEARTTQRNGFFGGSSALHCATISASLDVVEALLLTDPPAAVNGVDWNGRSALHYASEGGDAQMAEFLLHVDPPADDMLPDEEGDLAITLAALNGYADVVSMLLRIHDERGDKTSTAFTSAVNVALRSAAQSGHASVVRVLLEEGPLTKRSAIDHEEDGGWYALQIAVDAQESAALRALLEAEPPLLKHCLQDYMSETPLFFSAKNDDVVCARIILEAAEEQQLEIVDLQNKWGSTALHTAAEVGSLLVARVLVLEYKADCNVRDANGNTALHLAALASEAAMAILLTLDEATDVNVQNNDGDTALHVAALHNNVEVLRALLRAAASPDLTLRNAAGDTALFVAAKHNHATVVRAILQSSLMSKLISSSPVRALQDLLVPKATPSGVDVPDEDQAAMELKLDQAVQNRDREAVTSLLRRYDRVRALGPNDMSALHLAAAGSFDEVCRMLLAHDASEVNGQDSSGRTPLHYAAEQGYAEVVRLLLGAHVPADGGLLDKSGRPALFLASAAGRADVVYLLLAAGKNVDVNFQAVEGGRTALHVALENGHSEVVRALLDAGAITDLVGEDGGAALHITLRHPCKPDGAKTAETVRLLLRANVPPNVNLQNHAQETPLHLAVASCRSGRCEQAEAVRLLLDGNDVSMPKLELFDGKGRTALYVAAETGGTDVVQMLLDADTGASLHLSCPSTGCTPLQIAVAQGHVHVVRRLLAVSPPAAVNTWNGEGLAALHVAASGGDFRMVRALLTADPPARLDLSGVMHAADASPLWRAAERGHAPVVRQLLAASPAADVNSRRRPATDSSADELTKRPLLDTVTGLTPLMAASARGHFDVVALLLAHPDVQIHAACAPSNRTALHYAAAYGRAGIVRALLASHLRAAAEGPGSFNVDVPDAFGNSPLQYAASYGWSEVVDVLLDAGGDIGQRDGHGRSLVQLALSPERTGRSTVWTCLRLLKVDQHDGLFNLTRELLLDPARACPPATASASADNASLANPRTA